MAALAAAANFSQSILSRRDFLTMIMGMSQESPYEYDGVPQVYDKLDAPAAYKCSALPIVQSMAKTLPKNAKVLEVGAGTGLAAMELAKLRPDLEIFCHGSFSQNVGRRQG